MAPKASKAPKTPKTPKATKAAAKAPKAAAKAPKASKKPKETKAPKEPKAPKAPKEPKTAKEPKAPKEPKTPRASKAPKVPKTPQAPKGSMAAKKTKEPKTPKATMAPEAPLAPEEPMETEEPMVTEEPMAIEEPMVPEESMAPVAPKKMKIKGKSAKHLKISFHEPFAELQSRRSSPGGTSALGTAGQNGAALGMAEQAPGLSTKFVSEREEQSINDVNAYIQNIEQKIEHFLHNQSQKRQKLYEEFCHQFMTLLMMWNIDVEEVKKNGERLTSILEEQQKVLQQFQDIQREKIQEFKQLCENYLKTLEDLGGCHKNAVADELRKRMDILERSVMMEMEEEKASAQQSLLSLLLS